MISFLMVASRFKRATSLMRPMHVRKTDSAVSVIGESGSTSLLPIGCSTRGDKGPHESARLCPKLLRKAVEHRVVVTALRDGYLQHLVKARVSDFQAEHFSCQHAYVLP